jgi:hypothetical protein
MDIDFDFDAQVRSILRQPYKVKARFQASRSIDVLLFHPTRALMVKHFSLRFFSKRTLL